MSFDILVTIAGRLDDHAEALALARDIRAVVARTRTLGCAVEVRDLRLGQEVLRLIELPDDAGGGQGVRTPSSGTG